MHMKPVEILLVEDNPADQRLVQEAFKSGKVNNNLHIAQDGEEAIGFLRCEGEFTQVPRPDLILLDLNLPKKGGREVLAEIKADEALKQIPVVVMTTSQSEEDIIKVYGLNGNCYVTKPIDLEDFMTVISSIEDFWFTIVKLPAGAKN